MNRLNGKAVGLSSDYPSSRTTRIWPNLVRPPCISSFRKIATSVCYGCAMMLVLIFTLAFRLVARVVGAVAPWPPRFPATSLLELAAGELSSLPAGSINSAQPADFTRNYRFGRADFGAGNKDSPCYQGNLQSLGPEPAVA